MTTVSATSGLTKGKFDTLEVRAAGQTTYVDVASSLGNAATPPWTISEVTGLQSELDNKADDSEITTLTTTVNGKQDAIQGNTVIQCGDVEIAQGSGHSSVASLIIARPLSVVVNAQIATRQPLINNTQTIDTLDVTCAGASVTSALLARPLQTSVTAEIASSITTANASKLDVSVYNAPTQAARRAHTQALEVKECLRGTSGQINLGSIELLGSPVPYFDLSLDMTTSGAIRTQIQADIAAAGGGGSSITGTDVLAVMETGTWNKVGYAPGTTPSLNLNNGKVSTNVNIPLLQESNSYLSWRRTSWGPGVNGGGNYEFTIAAGHHNNQAKLFVGGPIGGYPQFVKQAMIVGRAAGTSADGLGRGVISFCSSTSTGNTTTHSGEARMTIYPSGRVGIGLGFFTEPSEMLEVVGNIKASGSITSSSDARFKENVLDADASKCLAVLNALAVKSYNRNDMDGKPKRLGFIAQEVQSALNSAGMSDLTNLVCGGKSDTWIAEGPSDDPETPGAEEEITTDPSPLELDYSRIACILWPVVQQQVNEIKTLQEAVVQLIAQVEALEARA